MQKQKPWLICVDSDGCAIDTMTVKHTKCFGPSMIEEWGLGTIQEPILKKWNEINLYAKTRGVNRFRGLQMILEEINRNIQPVPGLDVFTEWCEKTAALSEAELEKAWESTHDEIFEKALRWSRATNQKIDQLSYAEKPAFPGVKEALALAGTKADITVVSSANRKAVVDEWEHCGLLKLVNHLMAQDSGTKEVCLEKLLAMGYEQNHMLLLGDSPGDYKAAQSARISFYPILVGKEAWSWNYFRNTALESFLSGTYEQALSGHLIEEFENNLI